MSDAGDPFSRLVVALQPWLAQLVIIGGWAHRLYRRHPAAQELDYPPLMTLDADIALPLNLPAKENAIRSRLQVYGFTEEFMGDERPPATHYHLRDAASGFYVEFLAPLVGGGYDRKGETQSNRGNRRNHFSEAQACGASPPSPMVHRIRIRSDFHRKSSQLHRPEGSHPERAWT